MLLNKTRPVYQAGFFCLKFSVNTKYTEGPGEIPAFRISM